MKKLLTILLCLALLSQVVFPVWAEDEAETGYNQEILIQDDQETDSEEMKVEIDSDDEFISEELDDVSLSADMELIELDGELLLGEDSVESVETEERNNAGLLQSNGTYTINGKSIYPTMVADPGNGQCWAYANGIYSNIWGVRFDSTFAGSSGTGYNMLRNLGDGDRTLTADHLKNFIGQAALGASIRIGSCTSSCSQFNNDGLTCGHSGHSLILVAKSDSGFTTFERLTGPGRREKTWTWESFCSAYSGYPYIKYIKWPNAPSYSHDTIPPTISNVIVSNVTSEGYTVRCTVSDNVGVASVKFPTWTEQNGQDDIIWHEGQLSGNTASYQVKVSDHKNERGCRYITHIYAFDAAENNSCYGVNVDVPAPDTTAPTISNVIVSNVTSEGYTVSCTVSDNIGVTKVQFPTWTEGQGGENATWHDGVISGNTASCQIKVSDHGNRRGMYYHTDIYAWDAAGNVSGAEARYNFIPNIVKPTAKPTAAPTTKPTVKPTVAPTAKPTVAPTVKPTIAPTGITLNKTKATVVAGAKLTLEANLSPAEATTTLTWTSSNKKVATVDGSGVVKALKKGTAIITVKTANGKTATCKITVPTAPTKVKFAKKSYSVKVGKTVKLSAKLTPAKAKTTLTWSSSDTSIATVSSKGVVKGIKPGKVKITVRTANGKKATVTVTVKK